MGEADWLLILVRFALYLTLAGLFGLATFGLYSVKTGERAGALPLRPWLLASAGLGLILSLVSIALLASAMAGTSPWPIDRNSIGRLLAGTSVGLAWKARIAALVAAAIAALFALSSSAWLGAVALAGAAALATLAWTGHGTMDEGAAGWVHLVADVLHLIAAGVWVGALIGLVLLVARPAHRVDAAHLTLSHRALHGFGAVGTIVVGTIIVTGLVNGWLLVGPGKVASLGATPYGRLLIAKLALFVAMLGLASLNRFRLTPAFARAIGAGDHCAALRALRASLAVETACAVLILGLVAWLATLEPPASM